jgi:hypothetical protein
VVHFVCCFHPWVSPTAIQIEPLRGSVVVLFVILGLSSPNSVARFHQELFKFKNSWFYSFILRFYGFHPLRGCVRWKSTGRKINIKLKYFFEFWLFKILKKRQNVFAARLERKSFFAYGIFQLAKK